MCPRRSVPRRRWAPARPGLRPDRVGHSLCSSDRLPRLARACRMRRPTSRPLRIARIGGCGSKRRRCRRPRRIGRARQAAKAATEPLATSQRTVSAPKWLRLDGASPPSQPRTSRWRRRLADGGRQRAACSHENVRIERIAERPCPPQLRHQARRSMPRPATAGRLAGDLGENLVGILEQRLARKIAGRGLVVEAAEGRRGARQACCLRVSARRSAIRSPTGLCGFCSPFRFSSDSRIGLK